MGSPSFIIFSICPHFKCSRSGIVCTPRVGSHSVVLAMRCQIEILLGRIIHATAKFPPRTSPLNAGDAQPMPTSMGTRRAAHLCGVVFRRLYQIATHTPPNIPTKPHSATGPKKCRSRSLNKSTAANMSADSTPDRPHTFQTNDSIIISTPAKSRILVAGFMFA